MSVDELIHCARCDTRQHMRSGCCPKCMYNVRGSHDISASNEVTARIREKRILELIEELTKAERPREIFAMYFRRWQDDDISYAAITNKLKRMSDRGVITKVKVSGAVFYDKVK